MEPPGPDHPLVVPLIHERYPDQVTYGAGWPTGLRYAVVTVTGFALRVDVTTGTISYQRPARGRLPRWVRTRWRVVPVWAWIPTWSEGTHADR